ncbi:hypothetical protein KR074_005664 [Drosophila pseudoananassae]|nr:hypothetical protein KR074_005664 [Drosophila pseudoananassae]
MRSQSGTIAVAVLLLLLLTAASTAVEAELQQAGESSGLSTLPPGAEQPRRVVKRAPTSSFIGMRGKKDDERDTESSDITEGNWLGNGPDPLDYADLDTYYSENGRRLKKAPLAFVGMRGKKFIPMSVRLSGVLQHMEEERLREGLLQDFLNSLTVDDNGAGDVDKRAPTGFNGMRGKRPALNGDEGEEEEAMELLQKRAPVNSFVGMRGKKDVSHQHYKRAALSEFWHTFFKKAYDVRGKKQRFADFNNKFVAVRGKKSEQDGEGAGNWEAIGQQQYLVHPWLNVWGDKRAPNGFLGMRGKRPGASLNP